MFVHDNVTSKEDHVKCVLFRVDVHLLRWGSHHGTFRNCHPAKASSPNDLRLTADVLPQVSKSHPGGLSAGALDVLDVFWLPGFVECIKSTEMGKY